MNNVFVLYDRNTDSLWYPLSDHSFNAVSGPNKGKSLEYLAKPKIMRLHEWRSQNLKSVVLLPPEHQVRYTSMFRKIMKSFSGEWRFELEGGDGSSIAVLEARKAKEEGFHGAWTRTDGAKITLTSISFDGRNVSFQQEIAPGDVMRFTGVLSDGAIEGTIESGGERRKARAIRTKEFPVDL